MTTQYEEWKLTQNDDWKIKTDEVNLDKSMQSIGSGKCLMNIKNGTVEMRNALQSTISDAQKMEDELDKTKNITDRSSNTQISALNMNMSYICGLGMNGLFDWAKSQVMEDVHENRKMFELLDDEGKQIEQIYNETQVFQTIEEIRKFTSGKAETSLEQQKLRVIFKRSFQTLSELMKILNMHGMMNLIARNYTKVNVENTAKLLVRCKQLLQARTIMYDTLKGIEQFENLCF